MKKVEEKVIRFIDDESLLSPGENVLVALSGGPDSVFLLHFLHKFKNKYKIKLGAFHLNHNLRGNDSDEDALFCRDLCKSLSIPLFEQSINIKEKAIEEKLSLEETGRKYRYFFLDDIASLMSFNKIVTGHNKSENSETILLNIFKGSGLQGLSGIPIKRGKIIRPALVITKEEILGYLTKNKLSYRVDISNLSDEYTRNFIRLNILPLIKNNINPNIDSALNNLAFTAVESIKVIHNLTDEVIDKYVSIDEDQIIIDQEFFLLSASNIQTFVIKQVVYDKFGIQISYINSLNLRNLFSKRSGTVIEIAGNLKAINQRNNIVIKFVDNEEDFEPIKIRPGEVVQFKGNEIGIEEVNDKYMEFTLDPLVEYIDASKICGDLVLRVWKPGDRLKPIGSKGFKNVSDLLTDLKIDFLQKKKQLVLLDDNQIIWLAGRRLDDRYKITNSTSRVFKLWMRA